MSGLHPLVLVEVSTRYDEAMTSLPPPHALMHTQNMSTIFTFLLAMMRHPGVQAKAQAEIDRVVGTDRLPTIADRALLPYVRSVIAEVYRWYPAVPLGMCAPACRYH